MEATTAAAQFPAAMETISTGHWKLSSRAATNDRHCPVSSNNAQGNRFSQHEKETPMSDSYPLPTEPESIVTPLIERFHSGKVSAMMALYDPEAVFIANDGRTITDHTEIAARLERDLRLGLPPKAKARYVFVAGDIAQIVLDRSIDSTGPTANTCTLEARRATSHAAARMDDGGYLIDNNQETAVR
jgi:hypothetical protein